MSYSSIFRAFPLYICLLVSATNAIAASYDLEPVYVSTIGHYDPLEFYPVAVAVDGEFVYLVDLLYKQVRGYTHDGTPAWSFPYLDQWPRDIEVDAAGNIYVADANQYNVKKYSRSGDLLLTIGGKGTQAGKFTRPLAITLDKQGDIYVADSATEISKFDGNGNLLWNNLGSGNPGGDLLRPNGIALDSDSNIYVADSNRHEILIFNPTGGYLRSIERSGLGYKMESPVDVAVTSDDNLIVLDRRQAERNIGQDQVFKLDRNGTLIKSWGAKGHTPGELWEPQGLTIDSKNTIWVAGFHGHNVVHYSVDGVFLGEWKDNDIKPYSFAELEGATVGKNGRLYVTDFWNQLVQVFDRYGDFYSMWGERGQGNGALFNFPRFSTTNDAGEIYIDDDHEVRRFDSEGNFLSRSDWINFPGGMDIDSSGNVWVTGREENTLRKYTADLNLLKVVNGTQIFLGLNAPTGVAISPINGHIYVTDKKRHRILVLDQNGNYLSSWGSFGQEHGQFRAPAGITIDSRGLIYVSEATNQRIQVFTPDGGYLYSWDAPGIAGKQPARIWELALDGDYFLYGPDRTHEQAEVHKWALVPDPVTIGPPPYRIGEDLGYYIWSDGNSLWHLRWNSDGVYRNFLGTISTTVPYISAAAVKTEAADLIHPVSDTRIDFNAYASNGQDGIDIVAGYNGLIVLDLAIDGIERNDRVFVGSGSFIPTSLPLPLQAYIPVPVVQTGKPTYRPGYDLGFYIWQDPTGSGWHIRWSADHTGLENFTGYIKVVNGALSGVQPYNFESRDSVSLSGDSLSLNASADIYQDGLDFSVTQGATVCFDLAINGIRADGKTWVGSNAYPLAGALPLPTRPGGQIANCTNLREIQAVGKPTYVPKQDLGYYIWQDIDDGEWHIRWSGDTTTVHDFFGKIATSNPAENVRAFLYESDDTLITGTDAIVFSAKAGAGQDGIDFFTPDGTLLTFTLSIDGKTGPGTAFVGPDSTSPVTVPFSLISADTSTSAFEKPGYAVAKDLGYFLWRDTNAGNWHLRWSGDSTVNHKFTGMVVSSSGITSHSEYQFESDDHVDVIPSGLRFSAVAGSGQDGLDFSVLPDSQLFFDFQLDGNSDPARISYGANNTTLSTLPLSIYSQ